MYLQKNASHKNRSQTSLWRLGSKTTLRQPSHAIKIQGRAAYRILKILTMKPSTFFTYLALAVTALAQQGECNDPCTFYHRQNLIDRIYRNLSASNTILLLAEILVGVSGLNTGSASPSSTRGILRSIGNAPICKLVLASVYLNKPQTK